MSIVRETTTRDPFAPTYDVRPERYPTPRHADRRPRGEPLPGPILTLWTMVLWAMAGTTTILSVIFFGAARNGLWIVAVVFYVAGIGTLLAGWRRLP